MSLSWIARLLRFDRDGDTFVAGSPRRGPGDRLFGGLVAAQSLAAAGATADPVKRPQSLHAYFVQAGEPGEPVEFEVARIRDGRSFDTRHVTACQRGRMILEMIVSFHRPEPGAEYQPARPSALDFDTAVPKAPELPFAESFDLRTDPADTSVFATPPFWVRSRTPVEDDDLVRACALTFVSDFGPVEACRPPGVRIGDVFAASLDHSVWFHRPFRPDAWHLYDATSVGNSDCRGLMVGSIVDSTGSLVATISQETLWRV